ncbi:MAG: hypothetical protein ACRDSK_00985 [Actinophytocola sp.]|uniref:hypothetical protein n=1 Tax=Actinophytocola sp. TaxID=1872138 RepID=UPI003D6A076E
MPDRITGLPPYRNGYRALVPPRPAPPPHPVVRRPTTVRMPVPPPPAWPPVPPVPLMPPMPPPRRNGRATATLAALAVAFLAAAGVFAALLVSAGGDHATSTDRLNELRGELTDLDARAVAQDAKRSQAERHNSSLEADNAELTPCVEAMRHYLWDGLTGAERRSALDAVVTLCR